MICFSQSFVSIILRCICEANGSQREQKCRTKKKAKIYQKTISIPWFNLSFNKFFCVNFPILYLCLYFWCNTFAHLCHQTRVTAVCKKSAVLYLANTNWTLLNLSSILLRHTGIYCCDSFCTRQFVCAVISVCKTAAERVICWISLILIKAKTVRK